MHVPKGRTIGYGACALLMVIGGLARAASLESTRVASAGEWLELDVAVARALEHNPGLGQAQSRARALDTVPSQVGALPDPMVSLNLMNLPVDTFDLDQEPMTQVQVGVSQAIPFPGKRRLRRAAAEHEATAADHQVAERRLTLVAQVRGVWWQVFLLDRAVEIVARNQGLMRDFINIAQTRYSVGDGLQQDVLLAQLELSRLLDRKLVLEGRRRAAAAALNALLNRPADTPVNLPAQPPDVKLPDVPDVSVLLTQANEARPLLAAQRSRLQAAESRVDLSRRDAYPDFRLGAGYGYRQGQDPLRGEARPDFFSVMLSIDVPLYYGAKQGKATEQRIDERAGERLMLDEVLRSVEAAIETSRADYEVARQQELLLRTGIIPQAEQTVASMLAGYRVNKVDFLNVVTNQITLYNARISYWQALGDAKRALAELAAAVGSEVLYE